MHSVCCLMVFSIYVKFMKICQVVLNYGVDMKIVNTQRAITPKEEKTRVMVHVLCTSSYGV